MKKKALSLPALFYQYLCLFIKAAVLGKIQGLSFAVFVLKMITGFD